MHVHHVSPGRRGGAAGGVEVLLAAHHLKFDSLSNLYLNAVNMHYVLIKQVKADNSASGNPAECPARQLAYRRCISLRIQPASLGLLWLQPLLPGQLGHSRNLQR